MNALGRGARTELAGQLGIDGSTIAKIFKGKRALKVHEPELIERFLHDRESGAGAPGRPAVPSGMVPVYGYVAGAGETFTLAQQEVLRHVPRHPAQEAYASSGALEMIGESMFPRYKPRELVYFVFGLRPRRGDDAVIEMNDGTAMLKEYVAEKDGRVFLRRYYPEEVQLDIAATTVKAIHAVVGRG